jgi:uncharacterized repeat protein (TIGR01451 family)
MLWLQDTAWKSYYILGTTPTVISDSFNVYVNQTCAGTHFNFQTTPYYPNSKVVTYFGDGDTDTHAILVGGYATFNHSYATPGIYTIKHVFYSGAYYNGGLPIDSVSYSYQEHLCRVFTIQCYRDYNNDGIRENAEPLLLSPALIEIDSNNVAIDTVSVTSGIYYNALGNSGDIYSFKLININNGFVLTSPLSGTINDTLSNFALDTATRYFGFGCSNVSNFNLGVYGIMRAGPHASSGNIFIQNSSCQSKNCTLSMDITPKYNFSFSYSPPISNTLNHVTWDTSLSWNTSQDIEVFLTKPSGAADLVIGDTVHFNFDITPVIGDTDPTNNEELVLDTVKAGYDPNEMWVSPEGDIAPGTQLKYTIQFENTGNAPAQNIYVMDTLSDNVDIRSLRLVMASATMNIAYLQSGGHNIVKFDFPNIHLLDSSHHGQCDGLVIFNVNAKHGLPRGTTIFNHAGIFFDDNPVVMTDTVEDIIGMQEGVKPVANADGVKLYPNPANDVITVTTGNVLYEKLTISNSLGQVVMEQKINGTNTMVDVAKLPAGMYYMTLTGINWKSIKKFSKI